MRKFKVLVVDDSAFVRNSLKECFSKAPSIEEVRLAQDGAEALDILKSGYEPDYIVLDLVMPNMNGFSFMRELSKTGAGSKVIIFSTFSRRGAQETVDALLHGAIDFVPKPDRPPFEDACRKLLEKFEVFASLYGMTSEDLETLREKKESIEGNDPARKMVVFVGSYGALPALRQIFPKVSPERGASFASIFHLPSSFYPVLGARLHAMTGIPFVIVEEKNPVLELKNYMPGDGNLVFSKKDDTIFVNKAPFSPNQVYKPSIDRTLISVSPVFRESLMVVFLSGMGNDGVEGAHDVKLYGGKVIVQDPETAAVPTLPRMVARRVEPDAILPVKNLHEAVNEFLKNG